MKMPVSLVALLLGVVLLVTAAGCDETTALPSLTSDLERYYPLELNRPAYYQVDSIVLTNTVGGVRYDTAQVEARETLVETFLGGDGQLVYRGERWERKNDSAPFTFQQTYTVSANARTVSRSEDNLTFTKLVLPLRVGNRWDGNAAFDETRSVPVGGEFLDVYNGWQYTYRAVGNSATLVTGLTVDSVVVVEQAAIDNLIDLRTASESYAPGLGLVERFVDARHTQCRVCCGGDTGACLDLSWEEKAEKGYIIRQTLIRRE